MSSTSILLPRLVNQTVGELVLYDIPLEISDELECELEPIAKFQLTDDTDHPGRQYYSHPIVKLSAGRPQNKDVEPFENMSPHGLPFYTPPAADLVHVQYQLFIPGNELTVDFFVPRSVFLVDPLPSSLSIDPRFAGPPTVPWSSWTQLAQNSPYSAVTGSAVTSPGFRCAYLSRKSQTLAVVDFSVHSGVRNDALENICTQRDGGGEESAGTLVEDIVEEDVDRNDPTLLDVIPLDHRPGHREKSTLRAGFVEQRTVGLLSRGYYTAMRRLLSAERSERWVAKVLVDEEHIVLQTVRVGG